MSRKRYTPEQIISMLREAEVALAQGQSVGKLVARSAYRSSTIEVKREVVCYSTPIGRCPYLC